MDVEQFFKIEKQLDQYLKQMSNYSYLVNSTKNVRDLKNMYALFKSMNSKFYVENKIHTLYNKAANKMKEAEKVFSEQYIIDTTFNLDLNKNTIYDQCENEENLVKYIVDEVRKKLIKTTYIINPFEPKTEWNLNLTNKCYNASREVQKICNEKNIKNYLIEIYPGYDKESNLLKGKGYHYSNIIEIQNSFYLIDVTYSQFFKVSNTFIERIGLMNYPLTKPGYFMLLTDDRLNVANKIIKDGYIKVDDESFKNYFDGFTLSFRNGLFYEETNDFSYKTPYTIVDYQNFLSKSDNQINYEGIECLGYQKRPLRKKR